MNSLKRFSDPAYCLMRLIVGLLFACHGAQKLLGMFGGHGVAQGKMLLGGIIELGGLLIAIGLFTRVFAFLGSGMMAWAYFTVHAAGKTIKHPPPIAPAEHFFPILNGGEAAVLYCFILLFIFFYGGGRFSLDALIWKPKTEPTLPVA
jgi:putative oxidoreductase